MKNRLLGFAVVLIISLVAYAAYQSNTPSGKEKQRARDTIDLCHADAKQNAANPATLAVAVKTCAKLEADFRTKYGSTP